MTDMMSPIVHETYLVTIAQVSVLFAGFGGVSLILNTLTDELQRTRMRNVIMTAMWLILLSLFPLLLHSLGVSGEWSFNSALGVYGAMLIFFYLVTGDIALFPKANLFDKFLMSGDLFLLGVILVAVPFLGVSGTHVFLVSLYWNLFSACLMFLMVFAPVFSAAGEE